MENRIKQLEEKIADLKGRLPKHSVRPAMLQELERLEEELEKAKGAQVPSGTGSELAGLERRDGMYGYQRQVNLSYDDAVKRVREELEKEGFGVLTEIDVKATLKKKLNVDFDKYVILGACNPPFAYRALQAERDIGLVMPCNVLVYEQGGKTFVVATKPTVTMNVVKNEQLGSLATRVEEKLKTAIDKV
jgi:uncharacterized protein (DUF302 family)